MIAFPIPIRGVLLCERPMYTRFPRGVWLSWPGHRHAEKDQRFPKPKIGGSTPLGTATRKNLPENSRTKLAKFATEAAQFEKDVGRRATAAMKAARFITTRHSSWHGRTCT
jgi:hypothetical protein